MALALIRLKSSYPGGIELEKYLIGIALSCTANV
jgi:hypothetical protein